MKIAVSAAPQSWIQTLTDVLEPAGLELSAYVPDEVPPKDGEILLFYCRPEYAVEAAVWEKRELQPAIDAWVRDAGKLLVLIRRNRQRVNLFHAPSIFEWPGEFAEWCLSRLGLNVQLDRNQSKHWSNGGGVVAGVIAAQAVSALGELRDLSGELEASAEPLGKLPPSYSPEWKAAYSHVCSIEEKVERLSKENELLLLQLHQEQEELESHYLEARKLEEQLAEKIRERDEQDKELKKKLGEREKFALKELEEENALLLLQLHQVQEELEGYYLETKENPGGISSIDMDELLSYSVMLEHHYTRLLKSRSWKLMAPLREAGRLVKSVLRGKRIPRNRLPNRPRILAGEPVGGLYGKRTRV